MPPLYVLGYWYSKYQRYTSDEFMEIVNDVKRNNIPMDVMIFDMDWHTEGWTGWTWDRTAIPDPKGLIDWMHKNGLKVSLNLHPADGVDDDEDNFTLLRDDFTSRHFGKHYAACSERQKEAARACYPQRVSEEYVRQKGGAQ